MVGLDGPSVVLLSCSRTVLLDALFKKLGTTDAGVGADRGSRCWLSLSHLPAVRTRLSAFFRHVPFLSFDSFSLFESTGYRTT